MVERKRSWPEKVGKAQGEVLNTAAQGSLDLKVLEVLVPGLKPSERTQGRSGKYWMGQKKH